MSQAGILDVTGGAPSVPTSFTTDSGSAVPIANVIEILGGTGANSSGSGNTITVNIDSPVTVANGGTGLTTITPGSFLIGDDTNPPQLLGPLTDGQLLIGDTAGVTPVAATLTAGSGVSIVNGAGSITISASSAGLTWTDVTSATQALSVENGYLTDRGAGVTYTLPATASIGDEIRIIGKLGLATIAQNAGQQILIGSSSSTVGVGGSVVATNVGDCITLFCITSGASTIWRAGSTMGNWTVN